MSAKSFLDHSDASFRRDVTVITIGDRHPIQDPNRPQFGSERDRAASLAFHIEKSLTQPDDLARQAYWNELRSIAAIATRELHAVQAGRRQTVRQAQEALSSSDIDLTDSQIAGAANVTLAKRQLAELLPKTFTVAQSNQLLTQLVNEAIGAAKGHVQPDERSEPIVANLRKSAPYRLLSGAIADIYRDTLIPFRNEEDELGNIIDVPESRREALTRQILRSSFAAERIELEKPRDPLTESEEFQRAVYSRLRVAAKIWDIVLDQAPRNTGDENKDNIARLEAAKTTDRERRAFLAYIDNVAFGSVDDLTARPDWIRRTSAARQQQHYEELARDWPERAKNYSFAPDLDALADQILASEQFANHKSALANLVAAGHDQSAITAAIGRHAAMNLERTDFVMASRSQALIAEAWVSFAVFAGPVVPSRTAIQNAAAFIRDDFSRPIQLSTFKIVSEPNSPNRQTAVPVKITIRPALFAQETSGLKFPTVAVEGARFYKNTQAIDAFVSEIAATNMALPSHMRTSLVVAVNDKSKSYIALRDAAEKHGFGLVEASASVRSTKLKIVTGDGIKEHKDRGMLITVPDPRDPAVSVELHSRDGQRAARGKLIVVHPAGSSESQARMIGWQVVQSIADKVVVFGLDQNDYNTCQHVRRGIEGAKHIEVLDQAGKPVDAKEAYRIAVIGAPTPEEQARRDIEACATGPINPSDPTLTEDKRLIASVNSLALAQICGIKNLPVIQSQFQTLGEVVSFASHSADKLKGMSAEQMQALRPVATAMKDGVQKLRSAPALERALLDCSTKVNAAAQNGMRYDLTSEYARARGVPVLVQGAQQTGPAIALIGHDGEIGDLTRGAIEQLVSESAAKGAVIHTTAEPGVGSAVIEAASKHGAKMVVFSPDRDASHLSDNAIDALLSRMDAGAATLVSAQGFGRNDSPVTRAKALEMATQTAKSVMLVAAGEKDVSALIAVEAGQTRPVAVLAPNPAEYPSYAANVALSRSNGSIVAQAGRGGNAISPVGIGFQGKDGVFESNGYNADRGIDPQSSPMIRIASFTRPATVIQRPGDLTAFIADVEAGKVKTLARDDLAGLTAAEIAIKNGVSRHPDEIERLNTKSPEELLVVTSDHDRQALETKMARLVATEHFKVATRSQSPGMTH